MGARRNQFIRRVPAVEFADGQRWAVDRRRSTDDCDTGAVRQARIENWILAGKVLSEYAGDALNRGLQTVVRVRGCERYMLHNPSTICVDSRGSINHQVRDGRV